MQSLSLNSSLQSPSMALVLIRPEANMSTSSKALQDVIAQLAEELMQSGQLDQSSPLGKMLAKAMAADGLSGGGLEDVKAALDKLIHEKLGANFGASADSLASGEGQSDLMAQVLNGLAKAALNDLLTGQSNGASFSQDDMPILEKIAQFMDDNPAFFPPPDSGSWTKELTEDNFLDGRETAQFRSALDIIGQQLGNQQSEASGFGGDGGLGSVPAENPASDLTTSTLNGSNGSLGQLVGEMVDLGLESVLSGGGLGTSIDKLQQPGNTSGGITDFELGQLLGGLFEKGLEVSLQGGLNGNASGDLKNSASGVADMIVQTLLQSRQNSPVA
ncbi:type III secretion protein HrpZ [Pseudomonas floridensis]|uniref:Harpin HrpZ n=1 Tax=Pseudomonas floridensis TaxID=1958950 RepID=A0A1X0N6K6_9PSED|nr:type III secretion system effector HrpZ [Pseudomonas floridensis]ORC59108.1 type III secretion protein HrpZ [Pseudomonas floridensis]